MIRVVIADDSPFTCTLLTSYLEAGGDCQVVGVAYEAQGTLDLLRRLTPDVLTLDLQMPGGDGLALLEQVTAEPSLSVVVISGVTRQAAATTLRALELGAVDFVLKYTPGAPVSRASLRREIVAKVKIAAAAGPRRRRQLAPVALPALPAVATAPPRPVARPAAGGILVIGASTGGPRAVCDVINQLTPDFSLPCVVVQHLPSTFTVAFAAQLQRHARLRVKVAETGDRPESGLVLVAPGAQHLSIRPDGRIYLQQPRAKDLYRPSIDLAMTSAAEVFGEAVVGVLLTGSGDDGAEGLKRIRDAGGEGFVQEPTSCIVASMPERAIERAGADHVGSPDRIGQILAVRRRA